MEKLLRPINSWRCTYGVSICSEILYKLLRYKFIIFFLNSKRIVVSYAIRIFKIGHVVKKLLNFKRDTVGLSIRLKTKFFEFFEGGGLAFLSSMSFRKNSVI